MAKNEQAASLAATGESLEHIDGHKKFRPFWVCFRLIAKPVLIIMRDRYLFTDHPLASEVVGCCDYLLEVVIK